jgi:ADP-ribose pyrophosphatase YjhB (NUDIX family)
LILDPDPETVSPDPRPQISDCSREYPSRPIVGVGAVILIEPTLAPVLGWPHALTSTGVVLVRRRLEPLAGEWSVPGGAVEVGESLEQAIAREVNEETGLTVDVGPVIAVFDRIFRDDDDQSRVRYHYVLVDYVCRGVGGILRAGSDVSEVTVVDPQALEPFALRPKTLEVIATAVRSVRL